MRSVFKSGTAVADTIVTDLPMPQVGPGEVLLKVEACGLCGSDLHAWRSDPGYEWIAIPLVMGHEFVGTVVETAADVKGWSAGDRAVAVSIQGCLNCAECASGRTNRCVKRQVIGLNYNGAMAEYVVVSAAYLMRIPASMPAHVAATVEPMSVAAHAVLTVGAVQAGQKVVVSGAGFIGIACSLIARDAGAEVILLGAPQDAASRLPLAAALGIDARTVDAADWGTPDVWVEASGAQSALASAVETTRVGGTVSIVAMYTQPPTASTSLIVRRELELRGVYASVAREYDHVIGLLGDGRIDVSTLVDQFSLEDALSAFEAAATASTLKPLIVPGLA